MDNKEIENLINDMLNSPKPDKRVLSSAKSVMAENKPVRLRIKKQFYALLGCAAVFIITGVIFAVLNQSHIDNGYALENITNTANSNSDYRLLIVAISLIFIGIVLAVSAIIIRVKKTNKNK